jgi:hypothetical protein
MSAYIVGGPTQNFGLVARHAYHEITLAAKQGSNLSRFMVMIHVKVPFPSRLIPKTYSATTALRFQQAVVFFQGYTKSFA